MSTTIEILAKNPPAIMMVLGFLLIIIGNSTADQQLKSWGWTMISIGVILQVLWLYTKIRR